MSLSGGPTSVEREREREKFIDPMNRTYTEVGPPERDKTDDPRQDRRSDQGLNDGLGEKPFGF